MQKYLVWVGIAALAAGATVWGAYQLGLRQGAGQVQEGEGARPSVASNSRSALPPARAGGRRPTPAGRFTHFQVGSSNVKAMLADGPLMWIGTSGGVIRYDTVRDEHRLFDVRSGLLSNGIFHLSKIGGRVAVGTYGGGLSLFNSESETWDNYNIPHGLADAFIYDVLETSDGDVWIATWSGANRIRGGKLDERSRWETFTVENTRGGLPNDWVYGLREGLNGDVWFATEGGVALYRKGRWSHWKHEDGVGAEYELVRDEIEFKRDPAKESSHHARQKVEQGLTGVDIAYNPNYIVALEVAQDGTVWAGTWGGGLARFDGKAWRNYTMAEGLPANHVFLLRRDRSGHLWIGTSHGLALMKDEGFEVFTTADGLFAENVFSLALSDQGDLWIGGYGGVARFDGIPRH